MPGLLLVPLVVVLFVLRAVHGLTRCLLWACWQVIAFLISAALLVAAAWLLGRG